MSICVYFVYFFPVKFYLFVTETDMDIEMDVDTDIDMDMIMDGGHAPSVFNI